MGCKMTLSILFASIRSYQNHQALARLVFKVRGSSVAFVSLLRGTFDHVVPCTVQSNGVCELPARRSRDLRELEHLLGRPLAAASFNDQLAGGRERERFNAYVQNALRQNGPRYVAVSPTAVAPPPSPEPPEDDWSLPRVDVDAIWNELLLKAENRRTAYDRWGTRLLLLPMYAFPVIVAATFCRARLRRAARWLKKHPLVVEAAGYALTFLLAFHGRRYTDLGFAYGGALAFTACHAMSVLLRRPVDDGWPDWLKPPQRDEATVLWLLLHATIWAAACVAQGDQALLLAALAALFSGLGLCSYDEEASLWMGLWQIASPVATAAAVIFLVCQLLRSRLEAFALGASCCGHFALFLAVLVLALGISESYVKRQDSSEMGGGAGCPSVGLWSWLHLERSRSSPLLSLLSAPVVLDKVHRGLVVLAMYGVGQLFYSKPELILHVMVHLSMAPQEAATEWPQQAVLALQVLSQEEPSALFRGLVCFMQVA
eukprot:s208_g9.t1